MSRDRSQLIIGLGEGDIGKNLRDALDQVAAASGKPVTVWARERLILAVVEYQTARGLSLVTEGKS